MTVLEQMAEQLRREPFYEMPVYRVPGQKEADPIHQPAHYARWNLEPLEFFARNNMLAFFIGNVIKYVMRYDAKEGVEDLNKARNYLDMLIRKAEGVERWWEQPVAEERKLNNKPPGIMEASKEAAKKVATWSPAKQYATQRIINGR